MRNRLIISRPGGEWSPCQGRGRWPETGPDLQPFRWPEAGAFPVARGRHSQPPPEAKPHQSLIFPVARGRPEPASPATHNLPKARIFPGAIQPVPARGQRLQSSRPSQGRTPAFPGGQRPGRTFPQNLIFPVVRGRTARAGSPASPATHNLPKAPLSPVARAPAGFRRGRGEHRKP